MKRTAFAMAIMVSMFAACGGDSGGGTDQGPVATGTFKAVVKDNISKAIIANALVVAVDNGTGELTEYQAVSDESGNVQMELPKGIKIGFKVTAENFKDTYQFGIDSSAQDETLWALSITGFGIAVSAAGFEVDPTKGIIAGAVYWVNDQDEEEYVGCAKVQSNMNGDYRYFSDTTGLPAPLEEAPYTGTDRAEARYVIGNVDPGEVTVKAYLGDDPDDDAKKLGEATFFTYADSISINNIYADKNKYPAGNPTPADCGK